VFRKVVWYSGVNRVVLYLFIIYKNYFLLRFALFALVHHMTIKRAPYKASDFVQLDFYSLA